jgi:Protein of unknown function (DUF2510)
MPADWYADPTNVGELRYFDGTRWTEHVTINGVQTTAPYESPAGVTAATADDGGGADELAGVSSFTVSRLAQWRSEDEKALAVNGPNGPIGRFVTMLDGRPGYRFEDASGGTVLTVSKPSLKTTVEVSDPAGYPVGTITKVGRLHSRYDIHRVEHGGSLSVRLAPGAADEWELQQDDLPVATITRTRATAPDALNLAAVDYAFTMTAPIDDQLQRLLLAVPIAIDILDTQAL